MSSNNNYYSNESSVREMSLADIIQSFLNGFRKTWWVAILCMTLLGLFGYSKYRKSYVPMYKAEATFSITEPNYDGISSSYLTNSQLASELSISFNYLINNEIFYEIIKEDLGIAAIPSVISVSALKNTNILSIVVMGTDADMNMKVINSVLNNYTGVTEFVLGDTQLTILKQPVKSMEAINPYSAVNPTLKWGAIGFFLGLLPSIFVAIFVKKIKSKEDVEKYLNVTCMGALPAIALETKGLQASSCSILNKKVGFRYLESMRIIGARCEKEMEKHHCRVILVTSTLDGEGKSTVAMNFAYSLSKSQKKVMLIDGNLRKPALRKFTQSVMPEYDMKEFLGRKIKNSEAIVNLEGTRVLMLAPDRASENPVECLNSDRMKQFIEDSKEVVDYIIIDAPSCTSVSDAAVLAKYSDGVIYVVKEDFGKVNKIMDALQEFSYTRKPILGCVLNCAGGVLKIRYGYGYNRGYGKYSKYGYNRHGRYGYGRYGYGAYGRYGYGSYGTYGNVSEKEFESRERKISKSVTYRSTEEQRRALEEERFLNQNEDISEDI